MVLLTHCHLDHINIKTLKKLQEERPALRIGCCEWMLTHLKGFKNIDCYQLDGLYDYGSFAISPVKLYHDVENCGYHIFKGSHKTFHATDTQHLEHITAQDYNVYAIEHNYDEETINDIIEYKQAVGEFCNEIGSINTHLSIQQASEFIHQNKVKECEVLQLHKSENNI